MLEVPGVARGREWQVEARAANGEFVRCELAEQHRTGGLELRLDGAILRGHMVDQQFGVAGGADAGRGIDVLEGVGNAVHRPSVDAPFELALGAIGIRQASLPGDEDEGVYNG